MYAFELIYMLIQQIFSRNLLSKAMSLFWFCLVVKIRSHFRKLKHFLSFLTMTFFPLQSGTCTHWYTWMVTEVLSWVPVMIANRKKYSKKDNPLDWQFLSLFSLHCWVVIVIATIVEYKYAIKTLLSFRKEKQLRLEYRDPRQVNLAPKAWLKKVSCTPVGHDYCRVYPAFCPTLLFYISYNRKLLWNWVNNI